MNGSEASPFYFFFIRICSSPSRSEGFYYPNNVTRSSDDIVFFFLPKYFMQFQEITSHGAKVKTERKKIKKMYQRRASELESRFIFSLPFICISLFAAVKEACDVLNSTQLNSYRDSMGIAKKLLSISRSH